MLALNQGDLDRIAAAYKQNAATLMRDPDDPAGLSTRYTLLTALGEIGPLPLAMAARCAAESPDKFIPLFCLGSELVRVGRYMEAIHTLQRALQIVEPEYHHTALCHMALAHYSYGHFDAAIHYYDEAIRLDADDMHPRIGRARSLMAQGKLAEGMYEYECKWWNERPSAKTKPILKTGIPRWMGEPLEGKSIIFAHSQGFGDTIQFCRYIRDLKAAKVTLAMPTILQGLMATITEHQIIGEKGPFAADYYCTPMSACAALKTEYADVSGKPYIAAESMKLPARGKLKVGLSWKKGTTHGNLNQLGSLDTFHEHSMSLDTFAPLFSLPGPAFYSLQIGESADIAKAGLDGFIADLTVFIKDWLDTARAIAAMDVIVTPCTGTAHLAGAMGKPVLVLVPYARCWRWLRRREDTPWYDSMALATQTTPGDWSGPIETARTWLSAHMPT